VLIGYLLVEAGSGAGVERYYSTVGGGTGEIATEIATENAGVDAGTAGLEAHATRTIRMKKADGPTKDVGAPVRPT
jgi:hypothetical protein